MSAPVLLVVAKAPVPGLAKTRLMPAVGELGAARLAAAALLDTLSVVRRTAREHRARPVVALAGSLNLAPRSVELRDALTDFTVIGQRGTGLAERLAAAHVDAAGPNGAVFQIGMDTPQVTVAQLGAGLAALRPDRSGLSFGPAFDGGWWGLGLRRAAWAEALRPVPMSTPDTGRATLAALTAGRPGLPPERLDTLRDLDTIDDLEAVAQSCTGGHFAEAAATILAERVGVASPSPQPSGVGS